MDAAAEYIHSTCAHVANFADKSLIHIGVSLLSDDIDGDDIIFNVPADPATYTTRSGIHVFFDSLQSTNLLNRCAKSAAIDLVLDDHPDHTARACIVACIDCLSHDSVHVVVSLEPARESESSRKRPCISPRITISDSDSDSDDESPPRSFYDTPPKTIYNPRKIYRRV